MCMINPRGGIHTKAKLITRTSAAEFEKDMNLLLGKIGGDLVDIEFNAADHKTNERYSALIVYKEKGVKST